MKCGLREKCQKILYCKCLSEKQQWGSLEGKSGICVLGNHAKPRWGFRRTRGFRACGICSCCYAHSVFLAPCFSRAAQALRDHEETEESPAALWVTPYICNWSGIQINWCSFQLMKLADIINNAGFTHDNCHRLTSETVTALLQPYVSFRHQTKQIAHIWIQLSTVYFSLHLI